jgi:hypothetical protein
MKMDFFDFIYEVVIVICKHEDPVCAPPCLSSAYR